MYASHRSLKKKALSGFAIVFCACANSSTSPSSIIGTYFLVSVNSVSLPAEIFRDTTGEYRTIVLDGYIKIDSPDSLTRAIRYEHIDTASVLVVISPMVSRLAYRKLEGGAILLSSDYQFISSDTASIAPDGIRVSTAVPTQAGLQTVQTRYARQ